MCSNHWPKLIDLTRDEAKRTLRRVELEAYASIITAFRAQGDLTKEKKKILQELQATLSISLERHRAEVRRAVNDEKLTTIADHMNGPNVSAEWLIEGRRLVPLMPRLVPQTAFTVTANNAANVQAEKNQALPAPVHTGKDIYAPPPPPPTNVVTPTTATKSMRPQSPPSNVVILPSGMSIHIKGGMSSEEEELPGNRKTRSISADAYSHKSSVTPVIMSTAATVTKPPLVPQGMMAVPTYQSAHTVSAPSQPMRVTVSKSPAKPPLSMMQPQGHHQKVMMMTSSSVLPHHYQQQKPTGTTTQPRSVSMVSTVNTRPVVTSTVSMVSAGIAQSAVSTSMSTSGGIPMTSSEAHMGSMVGQSKGMEILKNIVAVTSASQAGTQGSSTNHMISAQRMTYPPRARTIITRPRIPYMTHHGGPRAAMVIPSGSQPGHPHVIKSGAGRPAIHIKQEGGMKIITQAVPGSGTPKYIPKHTATGSNVVVVTTVTTPVTRVAAGGKIVNISSSGGLGTRVITASRQTDRTNVVTVNPKSFHISSVKTSVPSSSVITTAGVQKQPVGTKPNVIVVQKAGHVPRKIMTPMHQTSTSHSQATPSPKTPPSGAIQSPFEKELVSFIQKQDSQHRQIMSQQQRGGEQRRLAPKGDITLATHPKKITVVRQKADGTTTTQPVVIAQAPSLANKSSILAELIQPRPQDSDVMIIEDQQAGTGELGGKDSLVGNQWVEMDAPIDSSQVISPDNGDASAIKALLDLQAGTSKVRVRGESHSRGMYEIQPGVHVPHSDIITIDQSGNIVQQVLQDGEAVQYIQTDQGPVQVKDDRSGEMVTQGGQPMQIEIASEEELARMGNVISQEIIGELDPNTGILYTNTPFDGQQIIDTGSISSITPLHKSAPAISSSTVETLTQNQQGGFVSSQEMVGTTEAVISREEGSRVVVVSSGGVTQIQTAQGDFLSSALDHADINLEPYQFMEEDDGSRSQQSEEGQQDVESTESNILQQESSETVVIREDQQETATEEVAEELEEEVSVPGSQMPDVIADVISSQASASRPTQQPQARVQSVMVSKPRPQFINLQEPVRNPPSVGIVRQSSQTSTSSVTVETPPAATAVAVESTGLDPTSLHLSEFTSQKLEGEASYSSEDLQPHHLGYSVLGSPSAGSSQDSLADSLSKRKRKAPPKPDEIITQNQVGGWVRLALGLLQRVSKYRGMYKQKGQMNAASWFTHPVNPSEVPDYYNIIQYPMDLSTIKRKLETAQYQDWSEFHGDMMLIRDNCVQYNPEESEVRVDCDEVFAFYLPEYDKSLQKWQQSQIGSPSSKKPKLERSPVRSLSYS